MTGEPHELLTAAQMRALEEAAIATGAVTGLELMERAGRGAVEAILAEWPELAHAPGRAVVLCGPGNNGGDGFVVARLLRERGWEVDVLLYGDPEKLPPDARANYERWRATGEIGRLAPGVRLDLAGKDYALAVDAIFGIGLRRPVDPAIVETLLGLRHGPAQGRPRVVALDVVTGIDADSGREIGHAAVADMTVAFHAAKVGHALGTYPRHGGRLRIVDIGLDRPTPSCTGIVSLTVPPKAEKEVAGHKYDHGHALVLAGPFGRTGAARLSARAALRIGAGLVTVAAPGAAMMECACQLTAIMLRRCDDADALEALLGDARLNALCLGPGLGTDDRAGGLVRAALAARRATVLDADALTLVAGDDELRAALHPRCVLTPHAGEFARLFPAIAVRLNAPAERGPAYSKVDAARDAANAVGCTIMFKGPDTVIADPSGPVRVNAAAYGRAAPWLATAGTGDVLAGMVAGLLARGLAPAEAAASAAWLHVEAALRFGPGLIAEDLPEQLPAVLAAQARGEG